MPSLIVEMTPEQQASCILDEWRANIDLYKFHDGLKHQRITHIITIQTALFALCGFLIRETAGSGLPFLPLFVVAAATSSLILVWNYRRMDLRARAYVDTVKARLLLLEREWNDTFSGHSLSTFHEQWRVLVAHDESQVDRYLAIRSHPRGAKNDPFAKRLRTPAAHVGEERAFSIFICLWLIVLIIGVWQLAATL